jgi:hypothetical protein
MLTNILRVGSVSVALLLLAACGSSEEPRKPPPLEETVFRDVAVTPLEKAKNVQNVVDQQKRDTDRAVDQNESDQ